MPNKWREDYWHTGQFLIIPKIILYTCIVLTINHSRYVIIQVQYTLHLTIITQPFIDLQ